MKTLDAKRVLEAALLCAGQPMPVRDMQVLLGNEVEPDALHALLAEIADECEGKGYELAAVASGWRFQSRPEMREALSRLHPERPARYSRAVLETLAIIAYRQPVTRGDIEDIRGVTVASHIVKQLEDRGWVESIGYRDAPGRPALLATTKQFLDDLGLESLTQLPVPSGDGSFLEAPATQASQPSLLDLVAVLEGGVSEGRDDSVEPTATEPAAPSSREAPDLPKELDAPGAATPVGAAHLDSDLRSQSPSDPPLTAAPMEPHA